MVTLKSAYQNYSNRNKNAIALYYFNCKKILKVLLLNTDDFTGGAAIACRRLLKALRACTGVEAKMLVQESKSGQEGVISLTNTWFGKKLAKALFILERLYFYPHEKSKAVRFQFNPAKYGMDVSENQIVKESDVLHLHWINFGFLSIDSLQKIFKTNKPIVWTLHDMWAFTGGCHHSDDCENFQNQCGNCEKFLKNPSKKDLSNQIWEQKNQVYQNANLTIVTCSKWLGNRAKQSSLLKGKNIITIPNPIDIQTFKPINKQEARKTLGLDPAKQYILFAAMKVDAVGKGFSYFKEALSIISEQLSVNSYQLSVNSEQNKDNSSLINHHSSLELLIFGNAQAADFDSLPFKVNLLGHLSDLPTIVLAYSAASVFVIPSLAENLPNTTMEAMACGTPCVGFNIGGIPEMIEHKHTGYLTQYKSSDDLAKGIQYVLQAIEYETLCQNARQKVIENYSEEVVANQYAELYASLVMK